MPDYDRGFKIVAKASGPQLGRLAGVTGQWQPIGGEVQATERLADRAFRVRHGRERFVVYMEAYTYWQSSAPWSILSKSGLLSERERLPTRSLVYVLLPRRYKPQKGRFVLRAQGRRTQQVWFKEICLWQQVPEPWWEDSPGMMALYPLCKHHQPHVQAVQHAARVISTRTADTIIRADLLTTLCIFGRLAYPEIDMLHLIGREQMKESKFFEEVRAEARLEGRVEGRLEGRVEGRVEGQRDDILDVLDLRFGPDVKPEFTSLLAEIVDPVRLTLLHRLAVKCRRIDDFRKHLHEIAG